MSRLRVCSVPTGWGWAASLMVAVLFVAGCGEKGGPQKYTVSGKVTYGGKPISSGDIRFEPKAGEINAETIAHTRIRDGNYTAEVVGGPQRIYVRDLTGDIDMGDPESPGGQPLFRMEFRDEVDLPPADQVAGTGSFEKDIEVPTTHQ